MERRSAADPSTPATPIEHRDGLPAELAVEEVGERRYRAPVPATPAEGRDVLYSGQLVAQILMASCRAGDGTKGARSVHALFVHTGSASQPVDLLVEPVQRGRSWASDRVTARQGDRVVCEALVLSTTEEADLVRHEPYPPRDVPDPEMLADAAGLVFPGAQWRPVPGEPTVGGVPRGLGWHRYPVSLPLGPSQAVLAWATCGEIIGLALRPHPTTARIEDAHQSLSTGVIGHSIHFLDRFDVADWLLVLAEGTQAAHGRVYGTGRIFDRRGRLVAAFEQDSMAKAADARVQNRAL